MWNQERFIQNANALIEAYNQNNPDTQIPLRNSKGYCSALTINQIWHKISRIWCKKPDTKIPLLDCAGCCSSLTMSRIWYKQVGRSDEFQQKIRFICELDDDAIKDLSNNPTRSAEALEIINFLQRIIFIQKPRAIYYNVYGYANLMSAQDAFNLQDKEEGFYLYSDKCGINVLVVHQPNLSETKNLTAIVQGKCHLQEEIAALRFPDTGSTKTVLSEELVGLIASHCEYTDNVNDVLTLYLYNASNQRGYFPKEEFFLYLKEIIQHVNSVTSSVITLSAKNSHIISIEQKDGNIFLYNVNENITESEYSNTGFRCVLSVSELDDTAAFNDFAKSIWYSLMNEPENYALFDLQVMHYITNTTFFTDLESIFRKLHHHMHFKLDADYLIGIGSIREALAKNKEVHELLTATQESKDRFREVIQELEANYAQLSKIAEDDGLSYRMKPIAIPLTLTEDSQPADNDPFWTIFQSIIEKQPITEFLPLVGQIKDINQCNDYGETLLHIAIKTLNIPLVREIIQRDDVDLTRVDNYGHTIFDLLTTPSFGQMGNLTFTDILILSNNLDLITYFLDRGLSLDSIIDSADESIFHRMLQVFPDIELLRAELETVQSQQCDIEQPTPTM